MTYRIIHLSFRDVNAILPGHSHTTPALMTLSRAVSQRLHSFSLHGVERYSTVQAVLL